MLYLERNNSGNQVVKILINCFNKALVGCSQYHLGVLQQPAGGKRGLAQCLRWEGRGEDKWGRGFGSFTSFELMSMVLECLEVLKGCVHVSCQLFGPFSQI